MKADGSVVAWGEAKDQAKAVSEPLTKLQESGVVTSITRNDNAIAALKADGSVVTWGLLSTKPCHTVQQGVYVLVVGGDRHVGETGCVTEGPDSDQEIRIKLSSGEEPN